MPPIPHYPVTLLGCRWFNEDIFELCCSRPAGFSFLPGQFVRVRHQDVEREYTLVSAPAEPVLRLLIKRVSQGRLSPLLGRLPPGTELAVSAAQGYFCFQPSARQACFIATGTGIAPFVSMCADGVRDFILLHGVRHPSALVYRRELSAAAACYVPCLSSPVGTDGIRPIFHGYVSTYVETMLAPGDYDFYLCGRRRMVHDLTHLLDTLHPRARVYSEAYD